MSGLAGTGQGLNGASPRPATVVEGVCSVSASRVGERSHASEAGDLAVLLRRLIDEAHAVAGRLDEVLDRARRSEAGRTRAALRLQERLRLGARMLQAFQHQIERVDDTIGALEAQQRAVRRAQQASDEHLDVLEQRLDRMAMPADAPVEPATPPSEAEQGEERSACRESLTAAVEQAEATVAGLAHHCAVLARQTERRLAELQSLNHQAARARQRLTRTLGTMTRRSQQVEDRLARLERKLDGALPEIEIVSGRDENR